MGTFPSSSTFSSNSIARSFSTLSSTIPQSLTQIGPATCEEIGNTRFASPWNHTGAFGSVNTTYSFRIGTRNASKLAISKGKNAGLLIRCLCPPRSWSFPWLELMHSTFSRWPRLYLGDVEGGRGITIARARLEDDLTHLPLCFPGRTEGKMGGVWLSPGMKWPREKEQQEGEVGMREQTGMPRCQPGWKREREFCDLCKVQDVPKASQEIKRDSSV